MTTTSDLIEHLRLARHPEGGWYRETWRAAPLAGGWQAAQAGAGPCPVACVVVPGFRFDGFELAPPGWTAVATDNPPGP